LWVENIGRVRADDVEVFLARAQVQNERGQYEDEPNFKRMNLRWSYSKYENPTIHVDGISPSMGRHCDFAAIYDPALSALKGGPRSPHLKLRTEYLGQPKDILFPGKYRFEILLAASNREPVAWIVDLHLTGIWTEYEREMFQNGFTVSVRRR
jgi:hypothetical protein